MNVIEINNISKSYTDFQLKDVSFNVKAGTIMGFVEKWRRKKYNNKCYFRFDTNR